MKVLRKYLSPFIISTQFISCGGPFSPNLKLNTAKEEPVPAHYDEISFADNPQFLQDKIGRYFPDDLNGGKAGEVVAIKAQDCAPWVVSQASFNKLNNFDIKDSYSEAVKNYPDLGNPLYGDDFNLYWVHTKKAVEGKDEKEDCYYLVSHYVGVFIEGVMEGDFFQPQNVRFALKGGKYSDPIIISRSGGQTSFKYRSSIIVTNDGQSQTEPFDLTNCNVEMQEIAELIRNLSRTTALPFIRYFIDYEAEKNGAKIIYLNPNYFTNKFNIIDENFISFKSSTEDAIENVLLRAISLLIYAKEKDPKKKIYFIKLFIDYPKNVPQSRFTPEGKVTGVKHTIQLLLYNGKGADGKDDEKFFILDPNGPSYPSGYEDRENFVNVAKSIKIDLGLDTGIRNASNACDTTASFQALALALLNTIEVSPTIGEGSQTCIGKDALYDSYPCLTNLGIFE